MTWYTRSSIPVWGQIDPMNYGTAFASDRLAEPVDLLPVEDDAIDDPRDLKLAAKLIARQEVADAVAAAMADYRGSSHDFHRDTGIDPAVISRLVNGKLIHGGTVATLAHIALALGKTLRISID